MTITSYGYAGDVDDVQWSRMHPKIGLSQYGVWDANTWKVAPAAGTRTVSISAGTGWGRGVMDDSDAVANLTFPSAPSGVRYDLVVMRRNWGTGVSAFAVVSGGSSPVIPSRSVSSGGGIDEQPLALVKITAGSSAVQIAADLRVVAWDTGMVGFDDLCRSYVNAPGTMIAIGDRLWQRRYDSTGNLEWIVVDDQTPFVMLWSGAQYMKASQVANLSQKVSDQKNGIILVWSGYDDVHNVPLDSSWTHTYVNKLHIDLSDAGGFQCILATVANPAAVIQKYVYITDSKITGHAVNDDNAGGGRVLRRVYGW